MHLIRTENYLFATPIFAKNGTWDSCRGEFVQYNNTTAIHGYTFTGFDRPNPIPITYDNIVLTLSDRGTVFVNRPFTEQEKIIITLKFGYPMLPTDIVEEFYQCLS